MHAGCNSASFRADRLQSREQSTAAILSSQGFILCQKLSSILLAHRALSMEKTNTGVSACLQGKIDFRVTHTTRHQAWKFAVSYVPFFSRTE